MSKDIFKFLEKQLFDIKEEGLYKQERSIIGPQDSRIDVNYKSVFKSNNLLDSRDESSDFSSEVKNSCRKAFDAISEL